MTSPVISRCSSLLSKIFLSNNFTDEGINICDNEEQPEKACLSILLTEDGIVIFSNDLQSLKIETPIIVEGNFISFNEVQLEKHPLPIEVTESGIFIDNKDEHPEKA